MLAPSVERASGPAHDFGIAARDRYPSYVEFLAERTGITVPLNRLGILQVALSAKGIKGLKKTALATSRWLDSRELTELEPALSHGVGAMFSPDDGAIDNVSLLDALRQLVASSDRIECVCNGFVLGESGALRAQLEQSTHRVGDRRLGIGPVHLDEVDHFDGGSGR